MAKKVEPDSVETVKRGPTTKYAFEEWFDGDPWVITQGEDFDIEVASMAEHVRKTAKNRGLKVSVKQVASTATSLLVQCLGPIETDIKT